MDRLEEQMLGRLLDSEDMDVARGARNRLVEANGRVCEFVVRRYEDLGVDRDDLLQAGALGLIRAANRFDPERGTRFSTYAQLFVRDAMRSAVQKANLVSQPPALVALRHKIEDLPSGLLTGEIAERLGCTQPQVCAAMSAAHVVTTLDQPAAEDSDDMLVDLVVDPATEFDPDVTAEELIDLRASIDKLPDLERKVVELRLLQELPRQQVNLAVHHRHDVVVAAEDRAMSSLSKSLA